MRKTKVILAVLSVVFFMLLIFAIENHLKEAIMFDESEVLAMVEGNEEDYEDIDRVLTKADFMNIELGSTMEEIEEQIGKPNGWIGSGIPCPYYSIKRDLLKKQQYVILIIRPVDGASRLKKMILVDDSKKLEVLKSTEF